MIFIGHDFAIDTSKGNPNSKASEMLVSAYTIFLSPSEVA